MAKAQGVWGIDIGQCGIKALRCLPGNQPDQITADAFDYIEYPQILSQPDANPDELISEALQQFLSRNDVGGDRVAVSVPGQNGLARFVKLPPVEVKKIPELVKYEARNQIPFDLDDVIWDYQQMGGGMIEEGFALDIEIGLFAMKREQVIKALRPFEEAKVDVDLVQLTPLSLFNYIAFDQMQDLPDPELYDPLDPPDSMMILSLGTETTDLVITDGFRVWQRSLPIGGSHFTKALTKELKQTFAKAEHIKRNAAQAENPKALFQAMRPVFADLVTEVQRSLNFFSNIHKQAKVSGGVALGNTAKLPGLVRFLSQNLKLPIQRADSFRGLQGSGIVDAPAFQENILAFPVCYGLCLQGLADTAIQTNLVPREIITERMIQAKKPWAVGATAALALGLSISFVGYWYACQTVREEPFQQNESRVQNAISQWRGVKDEFDSQVTAFKATDQTGKHLLLDPAKSLRWIQLFKVIDLCLPRDAPGKVPADPTLRNEVVITSITHQEADDLSVWYRGALAAAAGAGARAFDPMDFGGGIDAADGGGGIEIPQPAAAPVPAAELPPDSPKGEGYVITIVGHHYHNRQDLQNQGAAWLERTLLFSLQRNAVEVSGPDGEAVKIGVKDFGIVKPTIISPEGPQWQTPVPNPWFDADQEEDPKTNPKTLVRYDFVVQFGWVDPGDQAGDQSLEPGAGDPQAAVGQPAPNGRIADANP